jgi:hypothetical protein
MRREVTDEGNVSDAPTTESETEEHISDYRKDGEENPLLDVDGNLVIDDNPEEPSDVGDY